jgi:dUTP pyrophosphatase
MRKKLVQYVRRTYSRSAHTGNVRSVIDFGELVRHIVRSAARCLLRLRNTLSAPAVKEYVKAAAKEDKMTTIKFQKIHPDAVIPKYETAWASGMDLRSTMQVDLWNYDAVLVPTGLKVAIPEGFEGQIRPRSGLALKHRVTVLNAPGTIDADYRGEVKVLLINLGRNPFRINIGDRIAQLVIAPVECCACVECEGLDATGRGEGGFGSTGV